MSCGPPDDPNLPNRNVSGAERPKTPENTIPPSTRKGDTSAKPRAVHSGSFRDGTLDDKRTALLTDAGRYIPEVPIRSFIDHVLPEIPENIVVIDIMGRLENLHISDGRWIKFEDEFTQGKREDKFFEPLEEIFEGVVLQAKSQNPNLEDEFVLRLLPNYAPKSERKSTTRPDGYLISRERNDECKGKCNWYDLALTTEFKKGTLDEDRDDNVTKIVFSMQHTMSLDVSRRFTFGITMEGTQMRLWFCSRAVLAVSEIFDVMTSPDLLVQVFLSLAFADRVQLGWDPTVTTEIKDDKREYVIKVNDTEYETVDVLSDFSADAIVGRASRVFKVKKKNTEEYFALKDVWVETDRELEREIYNKLLNDVATMCGEKARDDLIEHLLTPVEDCLVTIDPHGQIPDHTNEVIMRGLQLSFKNSFILQAKQHVEDWVRKTVGIVKSSDAEVLNEKEHLGSRIPPEDETKIQHRRHYRIVFKEIAHPIWSLTDLSKVFLVLRNCAQALLWFHKCGWVHRDISSGNIYLFLGRGIIGDLEYAKKVQTDGMHNVRTGTLDYMALEVIMNNYQFLPTMKSFQDVINQRKAAKHDIPQFFHNMGHDVESLWWIAVYMLFFNRDVSLPEEPHNRQKRRSITKKVFPLDVSFIDRANFLRLMFPQWTTWLPASFAEIRDELEDMAYNIVATYTEFERDLSEPKQEIFDTLLRVTIAAFSTCEGFSGNIQIESYKISGKRGQDAHSRPQEPTHGLPANEGMSVGQPSKVETLHIEPTVSEIDPGPASVGGKRKAPPPVPENGPKLRKPLVLIPRKM